MLVINARFLTQKITGVQRFAIELSRELKKNYADNVIFVSPANIIQKDVARELDVVIIGKHNGYLWEQMDLPLFLKQNGNPLLINFANMAPIFYSNKISTLHDITYIRYPHTFSWKFRLLYKIMIPLILKTSKHIFTVSNFSKEEIIGYYKIKPENISIIYNAVDSFFFPTKNNKSNQENYILAVSSVKENKNFPLVINCFQKVSETYNNIKLYIIGDLKSESFKNINSTEFENNSNICFLGRVTDEELRDYYSNAKLFIFPSLYEGFGIPVLEAQACGTPVVSSSSGSLPEVLNNSAVMCDPNNITEFVNGVISILQSNDLSNILRNQGFINIKKYSWKKSCANVIETIKRMH